MVDVATLMAALEGFEQVGESGASGEHRLRAGHAGTGEPVIFGGQILGQAIMAAAATQPDKTVKTLHTVFARGGTTVDPLDLDVEPMHAGRSFGSVTVTFRQGSRLLARSLVLLHAEEPDVIRHQVDAPAVPGPDGLQSVAHEIGGWEIRVVGGIDVNDPDVVAPARLPVWTRFVGAPAEVRANQALLAYATDGFLIGTAMLPHAGFGQALSHNTLSTGVVSHTITFHEPFSAGRWLLLAHESAYAGRGRAYGQANVFDAGGVLVASFVQDAMIRYFPEGHVGL